ncbi:hypothetical protein OB236_38400 [Paenibacillus sp. WQ 127069]|uniref:Uncharacterized protein n=1 Tax=Paenibacillus baimaensis TaxID=2982185 RepID=A0ABT2UTM4_9BACL|nr:hypothetical protein [Paenibacillus sp. WQ 127069]MCU6798013.1 hypothetical protein [Paenibacillus sp. WQ 127069]
MQQTLSEEDSMMAWLDRRIEPCQDVVTFLFYQRQFKKMWIESFGNIDSIPKEYKEKVAQAYAMLLLWS